MGLQNADQMTDLVRIQAMALWGQRHASTAKELEESLWKVDGPISMSSGLALETLESRMSLGPCVFVKEMKS